MNETMWLTIGLSIQAGITASMFPKEIQVLKPAQMKLKPLYIHQVVSKL